MIQYKYRRLCLHSQKLHQTIYSIIFKMPAFSTLIIAAAFALSANAAALDKRAVSAPVQLCIDDINFVAAQLAVVKADVDSLGITFGNDVCHYGYIIDI
ncbi:hypothetical protein PS15p_208274 [Mucor circinelloides]